MEERCVFRIKGIRYPNSIGHDDTIGDISSYINSNRSMFKLQPHDQFDLYEGDQLLESTRLLSSFDPGTTHNLTVVDLSNTNQKSQSDIIKNIHRRTVLIRVRSSKKIYGVGTGVLIGMRYILTAAHVANPPEYTSQLNHIFHDSTSLQYDIGFNHPRLWCPGNLLALSNTLDIALLEFQCRDINNYSPIEIVSEVDNIPPLEPIFVSGFPKQRIFHSLFEEKKIEFQPPEPSLDTGYVSYYGDGLLEINTSSEPGYSGSGVILTKTGKMCGMIKQQTTSNVQKFHCEPQFLIVQWVNTTLKKIVPPRDELWIQDNVNNPN